MANTEILNALKHVRVTRKAVADLQLQLQGQLSPDESNALNDVYSDLEDLEDLLVLQDIKESVAQIKADAKDLQATAEKMKQVSQRLTAISDTIATTAKVVGTLADLVAKAGSSGLL